MLGGGRMVYGLVCAVKPVCACAHAYAVPMGAHTLESYALSLILEKFLEREGVFFRAVRFRADILSPKGRILRPI